MNIQEQTGAIRDNLGAVLERSCRFRSLPTVQKRQQTMEILFVFFVNFALSPSRVYSIGFSLRLKKAMHRKRRKLAGGRTGEGALQRGQAGDFFSGFKEM